MEGTILFMHGNDFFDAKKKGVNVFQDMLGEKIKIQKDNKFYFSEIKCRKSRITDIDTDNLIPVTRQFGKLLYLFLVDKNDLKNVRYALFCEGLPYSFREMSFIVEDFLLPYFGVNFYYYDYVSKIEGRLFLVE